ncbi:MAG: hypothetical protein WBV82_09225 [Myxococcaceae bacterium]
MSDIPIREEQPGDAAAIRRVNEAAFGRPDEANLAEPRLFALSSPLRIKGISDV